MSHYMLSTYKYSNNNNNNNLFSSKYASSSSFSVYKNELNDYALMLYLSLAHIYDIILYFPFYNLSMIFKHIWYTHS